MASDAQLDELMSLWPRLSDTRRKQIVRLMWAFVEDQKKPGRPFHTRYAAIMDDPTLSTPEKLRETDRLLDEIGRIN